MSAPKHVVGLSGGKDSTPCGDCGMPCRPGEFHPYAACLMFKACHDSETVRANLASLSAPPAPAVALTDDYGDTRHLCMAGVPMSDGAKRLGSMLVKALGASHPAIDDFAALALEAAAPLPEQAAHPDTIRLDWQQANPSMLFVLGGRWYSRAGYGMPHRRHATLRAAIDATRLAGQPSTKENGNDA